MPIVVLDESKCCGCMACANACPIDAIQEVENDVGFVYPKVDMDRCIGCERCVETCVFTKPDFMENEPITAYSLALKDRKALLKSSSGGAFTALSDVVLDKGGVVAGAVLSDGFQIRHQIAETKEERDQMRGSLYVQSSTNYVFRDIKKALEAGRSALFVGLPCQVAGLLSYLGKTYDKLVTVDLLCHGVPSASFFRSHVRWLEEKYGKDAKSYSFRNKNFGWISPTIEEIIFKDGMKLSNWRVQAYNKFFFLNSSLRPSCFHCPYRKRSNSSDVTLGDFWGIHRITGKKDRKGTSLVIINSSKGNAFFEQIFNTSIVNEHSLQEVSYRIGLSQPYTPINVSEFWQTYKDGGYEALVKRYLTFSVSYKIRLTLKKVVRKIQFLLDLATS